MIVDWFDASRGDPIADVARSSLTLLSDGANPPRHLPGADRATLGVLTGAYLARLREQLQIDDELLASLAGDQRRGAHGRGRAARRAARGLEALRAGRAGVHAAAN